MVNHALPVALPAIPVSEELGAVIPVPPLLTREKLAHLQKYIDHGVRLPTVSAKTAYKDISRHAMKYRVTLTTVSSIFAQIVSHARGVPANYETIFNSERQHASILIDAEVQIIAGMLQDCARMIVDLEDFQRDTESDRIKLEGEIKRNAVVSSERRELLEEIKRAIPSIQDIQGVFDSLAMRLKSIQNEFDARGDNPVFAIRQTAVDWKTLLLCGEALLI